MTCVARPPRATIKMISILEVPSTRSGFGATPPTVCQADNDTTPCESAIGLDVLTNNLQIVDTSHFSDQDMGNCSNEPHDDCDVSIGSWTDSQITVLLDDTGGIDCDDIDNGDNLTVQVFTTDTGSAASNVVSTTAVPLGTVAQISGLSPASGPVSGGTFNTDGSANASGANRAGLLRSAAVPSRCSSPARRRSAASWCPVRAVG